MPWTQSVPEAQSASERKHSDFCRNAKSVDNGREELVPLLNGDAESLGDTGGGVAMAEQSGREDDRASKVAKKKFEIPW